MLRTVKNLSSSHRHTTLVAGSIAEQFITGIIVLFGGVVELLFVVFIYYLSKGFRLPTDVAFEDSNRNVVDLDVDITDILIEKTAKLLSFNQRAVSGVSTRDGQAIRLGTTGALAVWKSE